MYRKRKTTAALLLAAAFLAGWPEVVPYATRTEMDDAREEKSALEQERERVEESLGELEALKGDASAYIERLDGELAQIEGELESLEGQVEQKEQEIQAAGQELEAARQAEARQYESMKLRIRYMYERGETSFLDMLFQSDSVSQLLNRAEYISQIADYDRKKLEEYGQIREEVARRERELEEERETLLELQEAAEARRESVRTLMAEKSAEIERYEEQIAGAEGQISEYDRDIAAQEEIIRAIEEEMKRKEEEERKKAEAAGQTYTPVSLGNISFIWPCPSSSRITSEFGGRSSPTEGASTNHKGVDIGAASGSDILAAASGTVTISTYSVSAGNYIMIDHGGGVSTVYMHCSSRLVSVGDEVEQGQVIAKVGSTGYSTGPHLHFGIRSGGDYVNPLQHVSP